MARFWTCRKCGQRNERKYSRCILIGTTGQRCSGRKPAKKVPKHKAALDLPYEAWVERFGERCGICGRAPSATRRLDRDHWHDATAAPRGLLCWLCNKRLDKRADAAWLRKAADYLDASRIGML